MHGYLPTVRRPGSGRLTVRCAWSVRMIGAGSGGSGGSSRGGVARGGSHGRIGARSRRRDRSTARRPATGRPVGARGSGFATAVEIAQEPVMDALFSVPEPRNEPVRTYAPGSPERERLQRRLTELAAERIDLPMTIDGEQRMGGGDADRRRPAAPAPRTCWASPTTPPTTTRRAAVDGRQGRRPDVAGAALRRAGRDLPARRRPARRPVAGHAQRARPCSASPRPPSRPRSTRPAS